jgi:hypothetical protein
MISESMQGGLRMGRHPGPPLRKNIPALVRTLLGVGWCDLLSNTVEFLRNGLA